MFRKAGFTLLEILIALFIFTIVSMIIVSALHTVFSSQTSTEKNAERLAALQMTLTLMARDFEQAIERPIINASGGKDGPFIGMNNMVTFTHAGFVNPLGKLQRSTLQRTRYRLEKENLIRDTWSALDQIQKSKPETRILLSHVTQLEFEYLDQNGQFHARWPLPEQTDTTKEIFPKAVRVIIHLNDLGTLSQLYVIPIQKPPTIPK